MWALVENVSNRQGKFPLIHGRIRKGYKKLIAVKQELRFNVPEGFKVTYLDKDPPLSQRQAATWVSEELVEQVTDTEVTVTATTFSDTQVDLREDHEPVKPIDEAIEQLLQATAKANQTAAALKEATPAPVKKKRGRKPKATVAETTTQEDNEEDNFEEGALEENDSTP